MRSAVGFLAIVPPLLFASPCEAQPTLHELATLFVALAARAGGRDTMRAMVDGRNDDITTWLQRMERGDVVAADAVFVAVHRDLRVLARRAMRGQAAAHTLQPTALLHEAYLRLVGMEEAGWRSRDHFLAVASRAMRSILVDHERRRRASKRASGGERHPLSDSLVWSTEEPPLDLLELDAALERLAVADPRGAQIVDLMFFGGLTAADAASVIGITSRSVERRWRLVRAWLHRELSRGDSERA